MPRGNERMRRSRQEEVEEYGEEERRKQKNEEEGEENDREHKGAEQRGKTRECVGKRR